MARKRNSEVAQGRNAWIMTYGDMMSLLLTFFVLIVSFSSLQQSKFEQAAESLKEAFGVMSKPRQVVEPNRSDVPSPADRTSDLAFLFEVRTVEKSLLDQQLQDAVDVEARPDGMLVRLPAPLLFRSGGASLSATSRPLLDRLAVLFRKFPGEVRVEGHTDDVPIHSAAFPSNWELSAARAVAVARYFQGEGIPPERLAAVGYGEHRPRADNGTAEGRAANRRVEILLARSPTPEGDARELPLAPSARRPAAPTPLIDAPVTGRLAGPSRSEPE